MATVPGRLPDWLAHPPGEKRRGLAAASFQLKEGKGEGRECPALFALLFLLLSPLEPRWELEGGKAGQEPEGVDALFYELS